MTISGGLHSAMFRYFQKDNIIVMALTSNHVGMQNPPPLILLHF